MHEQLLEFVNEVKSRKGLSAYDEAATKQAIVLRILKLLDWNMDDLNDIRPEYPVDRENTSEKVDYALAQDTDNMVFVEVKGIGIELQSHEEKFALYCYKNNVELGILTNGLTWWFYLPREKGSWYERKFFSVDLLQQDGEFVVAKFCDFLSRENVLDGKAVENAKRTYQSKQKQQILKKTLPEAWNTLITSEDETFVDLLNNYVEKISGYRADNQAIVEFLADIREKLTLPPDAQVDVRKKHVEPADLSMTRKQRIAPYTPSGYTWKSIVGFTLDGKRYKSSSWKNLLLSICEIVSAEHKTDFSRVLSLKGRKRPYFSRNQNELRASERVQGTDISVETNLSANSIVNLCQDVLSMFGYKSVLRIETN
jgi:predicted type IV restriction endonuclease